MEKNGSSGKMIVFENLFVKKREGSDESVMGCQGLPAVLELVKLQVSALVF